MPDNGPAAAPPDDLPPTPGPTSEAQPPPDGSKADQLADVKNLLPHRLRLLFKREPYPEELVLAPLESRSLVANARWQQALSDLRNRRLVTATFTDQADKASQSPASNRSGDSGLEALGTIAFALFFGYIWLGSTVAANAPQLQKLYWYGVPTVAVVGLAVYLYSAAKGWTVMTREVAQALTLMLVLTIGIGLSSATIYSFGGGPELITRAPSLGLLLRLLQCVFVAIAAVLPALLYYLFDREQLGTLRERFERQVFRLDPEVQTLTEVRLKYGSQLDEHYGSDPATSRGRLGGGTRWPILVCTAVITIGWLLTLLPVGGPADVQRPADILSFFAPQRSAASLGFLGAYYFAINMVLRRYTRGDLQPKVYSHITVRIVVVLILGWVTELMLGSRPYAFGLVFVFGLVPETFWTAWKELYRRSLGSVIAGLEEKHPLTRLEGIDLYDRSRLDEEGVTNVEGLAHHDLMDLILMTRIPVPRLVDWVDQAMLYLHLAGDPAEPASPDPSPGLRQRLSRAINLRAPMLPTAQQRLRAFGIRTATDFIEAYDGAEQAQALPALLAALAGGGAQATDPQGAAADRAERLKVVYTTLQDDEWLRAVVHWRKYRGVGEVTVLADERGYVVECLPVAWPVVEN